MQKLPRKPFSGRVYNALRRSNVDTLGILLAASDEELLGIRSFDRIGLDEVRGYLDEIGIDIFTSSTPRKARLKDTYGDIKMVPVSFLYTAKVITGSQLDALLDKGVVTYRNFRDTTQSKIAELRHRNVKYFTAEQLECLVSELKNMGITLHP